MIAKISGSNCYMWRGGSSQEPYTPAFTRALRRQIRQRDGYCCQMPGCGKTQQQNGKALDVHHISYDKTSADPQDLVSLCHDCHRKTNHDRAHWRSLFSAMMLNRAAS